MKKIAYFGVDYHSSVLAIAVMIEGSKDIHEPRDRLQYSAPMEKTVSRRSSVCIPRQGLTQTTR